MPVPLPYRPFSQVCIDQGVGYQQWQKTAETDKIVNLLFDQIDGRNSIATRTSRALALVNYISIKSIVGNPLYADAPAAVRLPTNRFTFNNALVEQGEGQFGLTGRFHRALTTVLNEITYTGSPVDQGTIFTIWADDLIEGVEAGLSILIPPTVSPATMYRIDGGDVIENTGASIDLSAGQNIELATGAVAFTSNDWLKDAGSLATDGNVLTLNAVAGGDAGVYVNAYTNANGTTNSATFTLTVT